MVKADGRNDLTMRIATCTKEATRMTRKMALESLPGSPGTTIRVAIRTMSDMATVRCTGKTEVSTRVNGAMAFKMELDEWSFQTVESKKAFSRTTLSKDHSQEHLSSAN